MRPQARRSASSCGVWLAARKTVTRRRSRATRQPAIRPIEGICRASQDDATIDTPPWMKVACSASSSGDDADSLMGGVVPIDAWGMGIERYPDLRLAHFLVEAAGKARMTRRIASCKSSTFEVQADRFDRK